MDSLCEKKDKRLVREWFFWFTKLVIGVSVVEREDQSS